MNKKADREKERNPRHIHDRDRAGAGHEGADLSRSRTGLGASAGCRRGSERDHRPMHGVAQAAVEEAAARTTMRERIRSRMP